MTSALYPAPAQHPLGVLHGPWVVSEINPVEPRHTSASGAAASTQARRRARVHPGSGEGRGLRQSRAEQDPVVQADRAAMTIARAIGEIDPWLAAAAMEYKAKNAWWGHGYARMEDHCREVFHRSGRWVRDLAVLGRAFAKEESLQAAFTGSDGGAPLGRCRAVLIATVATSDTLKNWIALARRCSVEELRLHIRQAMSGDGRPPSVPQDKRLIEDEEPDTIERCRLTLQVPFPVAVAFDEGLELYRVKVGHESTVTGYVKALMGEQAASGEAPLDEEGEGPPDVERSPRRGEGTGVRSGAPHPRGAEGSTVQERSAEVPGAPQLSPLGGEPSALDRATWALARFEAVKRTLGTREKADPADQIEALVRLEEDLERRLGEVLLSIAEARGWRRLGCTGVGDYAEQRLGMSRSWAEDRVRAARALRRFSRLRESYEKRNISMEAVLRVSAILKRAPDPDAVINAWVERASESTMKRLRDESRALARRGAGLFVERYRDKEAERHAPLDDLSWFRSLARRAGTARRRVRVLAEMALTRPVADTPLVLRLPEDIADDFLRALRAAQPRAAAACREFSKGRAGSEAEAEGAEAEAACREFSTGGTGGSEAEAATEHQPPAPAWAALLALIEDFVQTSDHDDDAPRRKKVNEETLVAFGWRCAAPGCTSRRMLQVHHVVYRSQGGGDEKENLVVLCLFHHLRGEHGELAACRGRAPVAVTWRLGPRGHARHFRNERRVSRRFPL
jgi:hypothetical protein